MAGFAVNLRLIQEKPDVWFGGVTGYLETEFLSQIGVEVQDLEPKADNCSKVSRHLIIKRFTGIRRRKM